MGRNLLSWGGKGTEQPSSDPSEVVGIHSGFGGGSHPALLSRLFLCRHAKIMRSRARGSNRACRDSGGKRRNWEELERPAKPAGLAKGVKDGRS